MLWEAIRKEPISHCLMLWSSSGIREARKEIGSAQPRWSKKLGGRRRGFTPRASVSSSITHRCVVLVFASLFTYLCLLFSTVDVILNWIRLFINYLYSMCSFFAHFVFVILLELVIFNFGV